MKKAAIWDLDGTLLDSYDVIVGSLKLVMEEQGVDIDYQTIWDHAITSSVSSFLKEQVASYGLPLELLKQRYQEISGSKYMDIKLMKNAKEILQQLQNAGVENYVYTHRGRTTIPVLDNLGLTGFFKEILTSQSGFARKPAPDAVNYLVEKYDLEKSYTYYVGDRSLDMQCAQNAGIPGILFLVPDTPGTATGEEAYIVNDLMEIADII